MKENSLDPAELPSATMGIISAPFGARMKTTITTREAPSFALARASSSLPICLSMATSISRASVAQGSSTVHGESIGPTTCQSKSVALKSTISMSQGSVLKAGKEGNLATVQELGLMLEINFRTASRPVLDRIRNKMRELGELGLIGRENLEYIA